MNDQFLQKAFALSATKFGFDTYILERCECCGDWAIFDSDCESEGAEIVIRAHKFRADDGEMDGFIAKMADLEQSSEDDEGKIGEGETVWDAIKDAFVYLIQCELDLIEEDVETEERLVMN